MRPLLKTIWLSLCFALSVTSLRAQSDVVTATIRAVSVFGTYDADNETEDYRFKFWTNGTESSTCLGVTGNVGNWLPVNFFVASRSVRLNDDITIEVEAWEEDGCTSCLFTSGSTCGDDGHCSRGTGTITSTQGGYNGGASFRLFNFAPGINANNQVTISYCTGKYYVTYQVTYTIPTPAAVAVTINGAIPAGNLCDNSEVTLASSTSIKSPEFDPYVEYIWEYHVSGEEQLVSRPNPDYCGNSPVCNGDRELPAEQVSFQDMAAAESAIVAALPPPGGGPPPCCFEPPLIYEMEPIWRSLGSSWQNDANAGKKKFNMRSLQGMNSITVDTDVTFRMRVRVNGSVSANVGSPGSNTLHVSPPPPVFPAATSDPSCPVSNTGVVKIRGITGLGTYRYVLRVGASNTAPCSGPECLNGYSADPNGSLISGPNRDIPNVGNDTYTLLVTNPGGAQGVCYSYQTPLVVAARPALRIDSFEDTDISCHDLAEGKVTFTTADGDRDKLTYSLALSGGGSQTSPGTEAGKLVFSGLGIGDYTLTAGDGGCSEPATRPLEITRPKKVALVEWQEAEAKCNAPGNGLFDIDVTKTTGAHEVSVSSEYNYTLFRKPDLTNPVFNENSTAITWTKNILAPGDYQIKVKERNGADCNAYVRDFTIDAPSALALTGVPTAVDAACNKGTTGSISFTATGGSGTFSYELKKGAVSVGTSATPSFSGLDSATYTLIIKNAVSGCSDSYQYENPIYVDDPSKIRFQMDSARVRCFDQNNGSVTAIVSGGTPGYSYTWQKRSSTGTWSSFPGSASSISSLFAGGYRLNVTDSKSCPAISPITWIGQPQPLSLSSVTPSHAVCYGDEGAFAVSAQGGNGSYSYFYSDDDGDTFKPLVSLPAGAYTLKVQDHKTCEYTDFDNYYTITQPDEPLNFTYEVSDNHGYSNKCFGDNTGEIAITPSGGNDYGFSGYSFQKNSGAFGTSGEFAGIFPVNNTFSVRDGRGCMVTKTVLFTAPDLLTPVLDLKTDVVCFGKNTGAIKVSVTGAVGTPSFTLQLDGSATGAVQDNGDFTGLNAGNYSVLIEDDNQCKATHVQPLVNLNPELVIQNIDVRNVSCFEGNDGKITMTLAGGVLPYKYTLGTNLVAHPVSDLVQGTYQITVTDDVGCAAKTGDVEITQPTLLEINSVQLNDIKCFGESGTIQITPEGGTSPYRFEYTLDDWNNAAAFTSVTPLPAGDYLVRTIDAKGCERKITDELHVTSPSQPLDYTHVISDYNGFAITCEGKTDGFVTLNASGGNDAGYSGYQYTINPSPYQTENHLTGIGSGDHLVLVRDARGCVKEKTISFVGPATISASLIEKTDVICHGASSGTLEAGGAGGSGSYEFKIDNSDFQVSPTFSGLPAGDYMITARDENDCQASFTETIININPLIVVDADNVIDASCFGSKDGSIALDVSGGVSPYTYRLVDDQTVTNPVTALLKGTYQVIVIDHELCEVISAPIDVAEPDDLLITDVKLTDIRCLGEAASINMTASGGTTPYTYEYERVSLATYTTFTSATPLIAGQYTLRVKDSHGCISLTTSKTVTQPAIALDFTYALSDYNGYAISCYGGYNGFVTLTPKGGNDAAYAGYEFRADDRLFQTGVLLEDINAGDHMLAVRDGRGCVVEKTVFFSQSDERIQAAIARIKDVACIDHQTGEIEIAADGGTTPFQYRLISGEFQTSPTFTRLGIGDYEIVVSDINQCAIHLNGTIVSINPEMILTPQVRDVSCFGFSDGMAAVEVESGVAPYQYQWTSLPSVISSVTNVPKGDYTVKVTDQAGCVKNATIPVSQPDAPLSVSASAFSACWDKPDGIVAVAAQGGTSPYQYSSDNGSTYQDQSQFHLPVGNYLVKVQDINGCLETVTTIVSQKNSQPEPNFIVATKRNALDTLVISDVSVPRPDSIKWIFDPNAIVISEDPWAPKIRFSEPGSFTVQMEGFFGGCGYIMTKTLTINPYDPTIVEEKLPDYNPIKSVAVTPNPNRGAFNVAVVLNRKYSLSIIVYDMLGIVYYQRKWEDVTSLEEGLNLEGAPSGVYLLRVITEAGATDVRLVITR